MDSKNLVTKDWVSQEPLANIEALTANRWHPCQPLLLTYRGTRYYLGSAVFLREDGTSIIRTIYKGLPYETYNDVLAKVIENLPQDPPE